MAQLPFSVQFVATPLGSQNTPPPIMSANPFVRVNPLNTAPEPRYTHRTLPPPSTVVTNGPLTLSNLMGEWRLHKPEPMQPGALSAQVALGVIAEPATRRV
jgi:hypothetical protein